MQGLFGGVGRGFDSSRMQRCEGVLFLEIDPSCLERVVMSYYASSFSLIDTTTTTLMIHHFR